MSRRVGAREITLAHGGHARLQLGDDGAPKHRQPVTRPVVTSNNMNNFIL